MSTVADLLPSITDEPWRMSASCSYSADLRLWDATLDDETPEQRAERHRLARRICVTCPVRDDCYAAVGPKDSGIRGGVLFREKHTAEKGRGKEIKHGTEAGYRMHLRRHEKACLRCRIAAADAHQKREYKRLIGLGVAPETAATLAIEKAS